MSLHEETPSLKTSIVETGLDFSCFKSDFNEFDIEVFVESKSSRGKTALFQHRFNTGVEIFDNYSTPQNLKGNFYFKPRQIRIAIRNKSKQTKTFTNIETFLNELEKTYLKYHRHVLSQIKEAETRHGLSKNDFCLV